jgi:hypothetical protein
MPPSSVYPASRKRQMTCTPSKALTEGFQVILADLRILWAFVGVGQGYRDEPSLEGPEGGSVDACETSEEVPAARPGETPYPPGALSLCRIFRPQCVASRTLFPGVFVGPPILFATGSLTLASGLAWRSLRLQLVTAFAGSMIGLAVGFAVVVYVLGVW